MSPQEPKVTLHEYLQETREALVWKIEGLSEYDARRPITRTGTNLLGLIKHMAIVEAGYFGATFGRPFPEHLPWWDDDAEDNIDLYATPEETRADLVGLYQRVWKHADETIESLELDALGKVAWWSSPEVTLHQILVHVVAEASRHAGHADIVREEIDGAAGIRAEHSNLPDHDEAWWTAYRATVEEAARAAKE